MAAARMSRWPQLGPDVDSLLVLLGLACLVLVLVLTESWLGLAFVGGLVAGFVVGVRL